MAARTIFSHCRAYPEGAAQGVVQAWLAERVVLPGAFHIGATGRSLSRIRQEDQLHEELQRFLEGEDRTGTLAGADDAAVRGRVQRFVRSSPALSWVLAPVPPRETKAERRRHRVKAGAAIAAAAVLSPLLVPLVFVAGLVLVVKERTDPVQKALPTQSWSGTSRTMRTSFR